MDGSSMWRLKLARRIAPAYAAMSEAYAIQLGGSAARGCADRYSDIEIGVFWDRLPSEDV